MAKLQGSVLGFLDKDSDERLIAKGDYNDSLNIRRQIAGNDIPYPVRNVLGNTAISNTLPSGTNQTIGVIVHEETNNLFYFVWNSLGSHTIYQYNTITGNVTLVAQDSYLNFSKQYIIQGQAINSVQDDGILLYFTDDFNPPRKINVKRAILHQQGDYTSGYAAEFSSGTDAQKAQFYDYIKHPPLSAPTFAFFTDENRNYNNLADGVWQFRYRFIYDDGEVSALSPWSELAVSDEQRLNNTNVTQEYQNRSNGLRLTIPTSQNNVEQVEVTFRDGNSGDEFILKREDNTPLNSSLTIDFYNDSVTTLLNTSDATKNYDGVPLLSKDMKIKEKRMFLSNVLDGYDNVDVTGFTGVAYSDAATLSTTESISVTTLNDTYVVIGFSGLGAIEAGKIYNLSFRIGIIDSIVSTFYKFTFTYANTYTAALGDTVADIAAFFINDLSNYNYNGITCNVNGFFAPLLSFNFTFSINGIQSNPNLLTVESNKSGVFNTDYASRSFKAGATHPIGVIYFDRAGRPNTVSKLNDVYVKWYTERNTDVEGLGASTIGAVLNNTPPSWANHYQIVYGGNSTVDEFLEYTCVGAYKSVTTANDKDRLYVSFRNFKGEDESFKNSTGALVDYQFVEGDRLRIKSYYDPAAAIRVTPDAYFDFKVVGFDLLDADADTNPIYNSADPIRTTGYFLILENPNTDGFDTTDGSDLSNGYWYNTSAAVGAYFEVYRRKPSSNRISYFEFGERYDIANAGAANRYHEGGVRDQNESLSYTAIPPETADPFFSYVDANTTTNKFVPGDIIECTNSADALMGVFTISKIEVLSDRVRLYLPQDISNNTATAITTITLQSEGAATLLDAGDVWYKPRTFFEGNNITGFNASNQWVEDYYANDFIDSDSWDKGRTWAFSPDNKQLRRKSSVYHSEPFFDDTNFNGLSSFNLANVPFRDYDQSYGGIQAMRNHNQGLILFKENKITLAPVQRRIIESTEGGNIQTVSDTVLNEEQFYNGDYGVGLNPESIHGADGRWYFIDLKRGKHIRFSNDGVTPISEYKMRSYFYEQSNLYFQNYAASKFYGGYDRENDESIITFPSVSISNITVGSSQTPIEAPLPNTTATTANMLTTVGIEQGTPRQLTMGNEERSWETIDENWEDWGGNIYSTNEIAERGYVEVTYDDIETQTTIPAYVEFNTTTGDAISRGTLELGTGELTVPLTADYPANPIVVSTTTSGSNTTLAFYEPANRYSTFYSFVPEFYATISSLFFSFKNGVLYKHNVNTTRNNFYGTQYNSMVRPVINDSPFEVKMFFAVMEEATTAWDAVFTTDLNTSSADATLFTEKEGAWFTHIPRAYVGTTNTHIIGLGELSGITGSNVAITGGFGQSGIFVGDPIYSSGTSIGTITAIGSDALTLSSVSGLTVGSLIYVQRNLQIEGSLLRGNYAQIELTNDSTSEEELYTVNVEAKKSYI